MTQGLMARKLGMSQKFLENGDHIPVTLLQVEDHIVLGKTDDKVKLGTEVVKEKRMKKPQLGFLKKNNLPLVRTHREFQADNTEGLEIGQVITIDALKDFKYVDVVGKTKGRGFTGGIKRHNFGMKRATHGVSKAHRSLGSTGQCQDPGRVFKGKKMAGHYGDERCTIQNLEVIEINPEDKVIAIKGAIPGAKNGLVMIKKSIKKGGK